MGPDVTDHHPIDCPAGCAGCIAGTLDRVLDALEEIIEDWERIGPRYVPMTRAGRAAVDVLSEHRPERWERSGAGLIDLKGTGG